MQLTRMTPQQVVGLLKATGSTDPDILLAASESHASKLRLAKIGGMIFMIVFGFISLIMLISVIGIPDAIPTGLFATGGWWVQRNAKRNIATIEETFQKYLAGIGAGPTDTAGLNVSPMSAKPVQATFGAE